MSAALDVPAVWAFVIAFAVFAYVVMDGFDLGIALLFPFCPERHDRDVMMNSVAPVWDGNETWLVLGGGGLFAAFPLAYGIIMPALYAPLIAMLLGLVLRGVAFEFRWRTERWKPVWDVAFTAGSLVASLAQGIALGALLQGLLGATWLVMKVGGDLQIRALRLSRPLAVLTLVAIVAVSLATPFLEGQYWQRWFAWPGIVLAAPVPIAVAGMALLLFRALDDGHDYKPFLLTLALFLLCFVGLGISIWPDIVPGRVTIREAAAPEASQLFALVGVAILIPIIIAYTAYAYWVFRGKIDPKAGYH